MKKINKKSGFINRQGFTLMELLLVMAIIGILASTMMVGLGYQRERTRAVSAMESAKSVVPYAIDCYLKGENLNAPNHPTTPTNNVCNVSPIAWPALDSACRYVNTQNDQWRITCTGSLYVACFASGGGNCCFTTGANYTCQ